ncbi:DUF5665 domain-containing protein [Paenibacillus sp. FJAT-26967]|uniref:DUF5665 domain-containing protein n=1 Tax=Paenibacillus sp. FJAT-26967 TaxID=1729690 RepID=UPI000837B765|nr:DUF5665 domain-containing protein [Paenibacillus sp. FJAT-26967]
MNMSPPTRKHPVPGEVPIPSQEPTKKELALERLATTLERSEYKDLIENYLNPRKRIITNFTAGLARGLGLTIGTTVVIALLGWLVSQFVSMPIIGEFIAKIVSYVDMYK